MAKTKTTKVEKEVTPKSEKTEVTVRFPNGTSRVYSLSVHGENFEKLAESFASKYNGATVE